VPRACATVGAVERWVGEKKCMFSYTPRGVKSARDGISTSLPRSSSSLSRAAGGVGGCDVWSRRTRRRRRGGGGARGGARRVKIRFSTVEVNHDRRRVVLRVDEDALGGVEIRAFLLALGVFSFHFQVRVPTGLEYARLVVESDDVIF